jgi:hypothetical protein
MAYTTIIESEYNRTKAIIYTDIALFRTLTAEGSLKEFNNEDALAQCFKIWLTSAQGEKLRTQGGGWLLPYIGKPMNDENLFLLKNAIKTGIETDFQPPITIAALEVYPNYEKQQWTIYLAGYNEQLNIGINTAVTVNNGI